MAKGYSQTVGCDFYENFSPIVGEDTIKIALAVAVLNGWPLRQVDVINVSLNGWLSKEICMSQPPRFDVETFDGQQVDYRLHEAFVALYRHQGLGLKG